MTFYEILVGSILVVVGLIFIIFRKRLYKDPHLPTLSEGQIPAPTNYYLFWGIILVVIGMLFIIFQRTQ